MKTDPKLRAKVERFLTGNFELDDLRQLVFGLRRRSFGVKAIEEIGDFLAHSEDRNKGFIWEYAQNYFRYQLFFVPVMLNRFILIAPYPSTISAGLLAGLEITSVKKLRADLGMGKEAAKRHVNSFVEMLLRLSDGRYMPTRNLTADEERVIDYVSRMAGVRAPFEGAELFAEFMHVLEKNKLATSRETRSLEWLKEPFTLLVVDVMHACVISSEGIPAKLTGGDTSGKIVVWANAGDAYSPESGNLAVAFRMFETTLHAAEWCSEELIGKGRWDRPVELRHDRKLHAI